MLELNSVTCGDCLEVMQEIESGSIDMILCDLPYGTTACKWDTIIPFDPLWEAYKRIIKKNGAIVLTASQPFTSMLVMSNIQDFKHHWLWIKEKGTGFQVAKHRPMMRTEDIVVFGKSIKYNPQITKRRKAIKYRYPTVQSKSNPIYNYHDDVVITDEKYPENTLMFNTETGEHPTQKPVSIFSYLIRTYTNEGDTVLDNCAGSGTTAVSCINMNRNFILIEQLPEYVDVCNRRIKEAQAQCRMELT